MARLGLWHFMSAGQLASLPASCAHCCPQNISHTETFVTCCSLLSTCQIINGMTATSDRRLAIDHAFFIPDPAGGPDILQITGPTRTPQPAL